MNNRILDFIEKNKVLTIATASDNKPYCATVFYAFDKKKMMLIFSSEFKTEHIKQAKENGIIAGTINSSETSIVKLQGIQFKGTILSDEDNSQIFEQIYYSRFPFARAKPAPLWGIKLSWIKMKDNTLGFGKKLLWSSN